MVRISEKISSGKLLGSSIHYALSGNKSRKEQMHSGGFSGSLWSYEVLGSYPHDE